MQTIRNHHILVPKSSSLHLINYRAPLASPRQSEGPNYHSNEWRPQEISRKLGPFANDASKAVCDEHFELDRR